MSWRRKKINNKQVVLWGLVVIWAVVIFMFSAQPANISSSLSGEIIRTVCTFFVSQFKFLDLSQQEAYIEGLQFIVRKTAHLSVYFILGILVASAVLSHKLNYKKSATISLVICFLYACSDEIHQIFVPGRAGMLMDVGIDTLGALMGIALLYFIKFIIVKKKPSV